MGNLDGLKVGLLLGKNVGANDKDGVNVGDLDGEAVGLAVGTSKYSFWTLSLAVEMIIDPSGWR